MKSTNVQPQSSLTTRGCGQNDHLHEAIRGVLPYWIALPDWCNPGATAMDLMYRVDKVDTYTPHIWA